MLGDTLISPYLAIVVQQVVTSAQIHTARLLISGKKGLSQIISLDFRVDLSPSLKREGEKAGMSLSLFYLR